jgi:polyhydroxybutyrate depolymerase
MCRLFISIVFLFSFILNQYAFSVERTEINIGRGAVDVVYPSDYSEEKPLPVIIALHGFTGNKKQLDKYWKLSNLVDSKQFILALPQGTRDSQGRTFWNATEACCNMEKLEVDDVGYLMELLDTIEQKFSVDPDSIHFIGWSNGGFMSYRMACEQSKRIASFVSLAGANYKNEGVCANASPVHVLQVHGTEDKIVEYGGGCWPDEVIEGKFNCYASALESVTDWAKINGCETLPRQLGPLDLDKSIPGPDTTVLLFEHKAGGAVTELWSVHGAGHGPRFNQRYTNMVIDWLLSHRRIGAKQSKVDPALDAAQ